jgi:hypothetical protein
MGLAAARSRITGAKGRSDAGWVRSVGAQLGPWAAGFGMESASLCLSLVVVSYHLLATTDSCYYLEAPLVSSSSP